ncbi:MAG: sulfotransferase domain-containing protein, partial [Pseudomonadales bacterium]|nr:sulfotransferase domain-containing protein [Pseudomonadales bacterium]
DDVLEKLSAQTHRRFIKTHTPLDGLPYFDDVTYLCVGRDPRDAFISMQPHLKNMNPKSFVTMMGNATHEVVLPDMSEDDLGVRFQRWMSASGKPGERDDAGTPSVMNFVSTFWQYRHLSNINFIHYNDLKTDLPKEMQRIANILNIEVPQEKWPELVAAATFENMKSKADNIAPDAEKNLWNNNSSFFNSGKSEQWRGLLSEEDIAVYHQQLKEHATPELAHWLEFGANTD